MHNVLVLALVAELMQTAHQFVRLMETGKSGEHHIARTAVQLDLLDKELSHLFDIENSDGTPRLRGGGGRMGVVSVPTHSFHLLPQQENQGPIINSSSRSNRSSRRSRSNSTSMKYWM